MTIFEKSQSLNNALVSSGFEPSKLDINFSHSELFNDADLCFHWTEFSFEKLINILSYWVTPQNRNKRSFFSNSPSLPPITKLVTKRSSSFEAFSLKQWNMSFAIRKNWLFFWQWSQGKVNSYDEIHALWCKADSIVWIMLDDDMYNELFEFQWKKMPLFKRIDELFPHIMCYNKGWVPISIKTN